MIPYYVIYFNLLFIPLCALLAVHHARRKEAGWCTLAVTGLVVNLLVVLLRLPQ
jgi:hypothetical protein